MEKEEIRRSYDKIGGRLYDLRYSEEQERKFSAAISRVSFLQDDLGLDVGCGTGLLLEKISNCVGVAVGLDLSRGLISWARSKLKESQNAVLILSDADYLPFRQRTFDKLFAITLLQNISNPREALSEAIRVTRSEATMVVSGLKKKYSKEELTALIASVGLTVQGLVDGELKDFVAICRKGSPFRG